eukprot:2609666-Karenia_brevis.AAC.1
MEYSVYCKHASPGLLFQLWAATLPILIWSSPSEEPKHGLTAIVETSAGSEQHNEENPGSRGATSHRNLQAKSPHWPR